MSGRWYFWPEGPCYICVDGACLTKWVQWDDDEVPEDIARQLEAHMIPIVMGRKQRIRVFGYQCLDIPDHFQARLHAVPCVSDPECPYP